MRSQNNKIVFWSYITFGALVSLVMVMRILAGDYRKAFGCFMIAAGEFALAFVLWHDGPKGCQMKNRVWFIGMFLILAGIAIHFNCALTETPA